MIRENIRVTWKMVVWCKVELTGVATLQSLSANRVSVANAITVWAAIFFDVNDPPC